jgi:hypothetical protein
LQALEIKTSARVDLLCASQQLTLIDWDIAIERRDAARVWSGMKRGSRFSSTCSKLLKSITFLILD